MFSLKINLKIQLKKYFKKISKVTYFNIRHSRQKYLNNTI